MTCKPGVGQASTEHVHRRTVHGIQRDQHPGRSVLRCRVLDSRQIADQGDAVQVRLGGPRRHESDGVVAEFGPLLHRADQRQQHSRRFRRRGSVATVGPPAQPDGTPARATCRSIVTAVTTATNTRNTHPRPRSTCCRTNASPIIDPTPIEAVPTMCLNSSSRRRLERAAVEMVHHRRGVPERHRRDQQEPLDPDHVDTDRPPQLLSRERDADTDQSGRHISEDQPTLDRARMHGRVGPSVENRGRCGNVEVARPLVGLRALFRRPLGRILRWVPPVHCVLPGQYDDSVY